MGVYIVCLSQSLLSVYTDVESQWTCVATHPVKCNVRLKAKCSIYKVVNQHFAIQCHSTNVWTWGVHVLTQLFKVMLIDSYHRGNIVFIRSVTGLVIGYFWRIAKMKHFISLHAAYKSGSPTHLPTEHPGQKIYILSIIYNHAL